jgi:hypothetical protein
MLARTAKEIDMQRHGKRKLELNRETIRALTRQEMSAVAGGFGKVTDICNPTTLPPPKTGTCFACPGGGTQNCPAPTAVCTFFPKAMG